MKTPAWLKTRFLATAAFGSSFLTPAQTQGQDLLEQLKNLTRDGVAKAKHEGAVNQQALVRTIQSYNIPKIKTRLASYQDNPQTDRRIQADLDIHAALAFYCDPSISVKIAGFQSADGKELIRTDKNNQYFYVWQVDEKRTDVLENIYSALDPVSRFKICTTYDPQTGILAHHLGGMDKNDLIDFGYAMGASSGLVSKRAVDGATYAEKALKTFQKAHPGVVAKHDIYCHSFGCSSAPAMMTDLLNNGQDVTRVIMMAPYGAVASCQAIEDALGLTPAEFLKPVISLAPQRDIYRDAGLPAGQLVGHIMKTNVPDHELIYFVEYYNRKQANVGLKR